MFLDFSKLLYITVHELLRRAWVGFKHHLPFTASVLMLPALLAEASCARRMENMVRRLTAMGVKIDLVRADLNSGRNAAAIVGDAHFRRMLAVVKTDMRALQCEAAAWQCDRHAGVASARLTAALTAVATVSERIHALADGLLWELAERDRQRGA
ncbi:MAG: hypothetical protein JWP59_2760 [Massilia sp.]|jgi:hypothetical protein|nr:hypothetical protein [Massilia sp.]